jgi:hypothetical protein
MAARPQPLTWVVVPKDTDKLDAVLRVSLAALHRVSPKQADREDGHLWGRGYSIGSCISSRKKESVMAFDPMSWAFGKALGWATDRAARACMSKPISGNLLKACQRWAPFVLDGHYPQLFSEPTCLVTTVVARRTFWEKATILHAEYYRPLEKPLLARYSRHYADVAVMSTANVKQEARDGHSPAQQRVRSQWCICGMGAGRGPGNDS